MRVGLEVEGRLRGVRTLFLDASELSVNVNTVAKASGVTHIRIRDLQNELNYFRINAFIEASFLITLDVTAVFAPPPPNIGIVLTMPYTYWQSLKHLRLTDQVRFHDQKRKTMVVSLRHFDPTQPEEFDYDQELPDSRQP